MSLLSLQNKVEELTLKLNVPESRTFILETVIDVLLRFPILTNAVLSAEVDLIWNFMKKRRLSSTQNSLTIHSLKKSLATSPSSDFLLTANISEWNAGEGYLLLESEQETIKQFLLPLQTQFLATCANKLTKITCIPEHYYAPLSILLPTSAFLFHASSMIETPHTAWFSILQIEEFLDSRCTITLRHLKSPAKKKIVKLICPQKLIFRFIRPKSVIGLYNFTQLDSVLVSCAEETIFIILDKEKNSVDTKGLTDFTSSPTKISEIGPNMSGISSLVTILAVSGNKPINVNGTTLDRFAVKVKDASGIVDITSWGDVANEFCRLYPGQIVLFTNLTSSEKNPEGKFFIKAQPEYNARSTIVSSIQAFLKSETVLSVRPLESINTDAFIVSDITVLAYSSPPYCKLAHSTCGKPLNLEHTIWTCPICKVELLPGSLDQTCMVYTINWNITDKSMSLRCEALTSASSTMIGVSADDFHGLTSQKQASLLEDVLKNRFRAGITSFADYKKNPSARHHRVEMVLKLGTD